MKSKKGSTDQTIGGAVNAKPEKQSKSEKRSKKDKEHKKSKQKAAAVAAAAAAADKSNNAPADQSANSNHPSNNGGGPPAKKAAKKRNTTPGGRLLRPHSQLDPLLLARGMSSRRLSSRISHRLASLARDDVERDLRHMEAYRNARDGYNQQLFVFENQELVRSGYFGTFAPFPGADGDMVRPPKTPSSSAAAGVTAVGMASSKSPFSMPIKIDPEEEKRLSLLRKKIHQSEFEREKLETEYLSLRAHYVHESQLVRKTRSYELGRWRLLREVMVRRAAVLGWSRARVAIGRDIEGLLKHRGKLAEMVRSGDAEARTVDDAKGAAALMGTTSGNTSAKSGVAAGFQSVAAASGETKQTENSVDFVEVWNNINTRLKEAEVACTEIETPAVLSQMVLGSQDPRASGSNSTGRSRSPRGNDGICTKGRKGSDSVAEAEGAATGNNDSSSSSSNNNGNDNSTSNNSSSNNNSNSKKSNSVIPPGLESHVIPWDSVVEPQTPFEVPLLLSCLSSATDKTVGFVADKTNPTAITWLESTLPASTSAYDANARDLIRLREEARVLEEEMAREGETNTKLRERISEERRRGDSMVAMMQLLRSETEAVLERHNLIMETPEARAKSTELHKKLLEEEELENPSAEGEEEGEEEEVDEQEELSSVEDEIQDDNEEEEKSDDDSVGIKEITVDKESNDVHAGEETDDDDEEEEEGDVSEEEGDEEEGEVIEEEEPRRSKRRPSLADDEESSSLTPPNGNLSPHRKRRRY